ncbi:MAG: hypothetical protein ACPHQP_05495 [Longimicrobiales bacterium]
MIWLLTTAQQGLLFFATLFFVGCVSWRVVVAPGASAHMVEVGAELGAVARAVIRWARMAALALIAAWVLRMVVQVAAFRDPFAPSGTTSRYSCSRRPGARSGWLRAWSSSASP